MTDYLVKATPIDVTPSLVARWWDRVDTSAGTDRCWWWTGNVRPDGYGVLRTIGSRDRLSLQAHRISYRIFCGPIPEGLVLDHLCGNPTCVNPCHLEAVTAAENIRRAKPTHCPNGHEYEGVGGCLVCKAAYAKRRSEDFNRRRKARLDARRGTRDAAVLDALLAAYRDSPTVEAADVARVLRTRGMNLNPIGVGYVLANLARAGKCEARRVRTKNRYRPALVPRVAGPTSTEEAS